MTLENLNKIMREDPYIQAICKSMDLELEEVEKVAEIIYNNMFLDTIDEKYGIPAFAKTLDLVLNVEQSTQEKRQAIQAKWRMKGKCTEELLQATADTWIFDEAIVKFEDYIKVNFKTIGGVPEKLKELIDLLDKVKPAYLVVNYIFNWLYWDLWESWKMSFDEIESKNLTWDEFEATIFRP